MVRPLRLTRNRPRWDAAPWGLAAPCYPSAMFWKLILTGAIILGAFLVIRARQERPRESAVCARVGRPILSPGLVRSLAFVLIGLVLGGTGLYLARSWHQGREVLRVQIVNASSGLVTDFRARRRDIEGRGFRTLEGQVIRLADVERMILTPAHPERRP